ncbi:hypothetical protein ILUMI_24950 [Ignelater luminosus]|uniref:Peptidoglycan-recognition protein n=1 Tax=Ignelater luminosus TaxID=2038154 RepID=A0A8K0C9B5_IGNLU|nr:hypothetical protein ILUMI_24950 [Ignelater luminosus]
MLASALKTKKMLKALNVLITYRLLCVFDSVIAGEAKLPEICPNILTREQWGGRAPEFINYTIFPIDYVIIHHTVTPLCATKESCSRQIRSIQNYQMQAPLNFGDIGYNFLIGGDGKVYEGRGWHKEGAHTRGYNKNSIGIAFIGTFTDVAPPLEQLQAAKDLLECGVKLGELSENYKLYGARQVKATESPGVKLFKKIMKWPHFAEPEK